MFLVIALFLAVICAATAVRVGWVAMQTWLRGD